MYNVSYFKANEEEEVLAFMKAHPFVVICGIDANNKPVATHLPIVMEQRNEKLVLLAHAMRKQDHTIAFQNNKDVLVIFQSASSYVSATNYEQQNTASTWNYNAVHIKGKLNFVDDEGLVDILKKLTHQFERNPNSTALVEKMDKSYVSNHMKAIVGFEIEVVDIQHVFKMSQNKDEATRNKVIESLTNGNTESQEVAKMMGSFYKK